jgi:hypothetical protein
MAILTVGLLVGVVSIVSFLTSRDEKVDFFEQSYDMN